MATQLAQSPCSQVTCVFASARSTNPALADLVALYPGRVIFVKLDVTDGAECDKAAEKIGTMVSAGGLDVLINNAVADPRAGPERMQGEE